MKRVVFDFEFTAEHSIVLGVRQVPSQHVIKYFLFSFPCIFRSSVKNDCVNAEQTGLCIVFFFFFSEKKKQENRTTSVNTLRQQQDSLQSLTSQNNNSHMRLCFKAL